MATTKTNRQVNETWQNEANLNCQIKEIQEANKQLDEQAKKIREQKRKNLEAIKQLKERKRELNGKECKKTPIWNQGTPIHKIAFPYKYDDLRNLVNIWQEGIKEKINIQTVYFDFDPKFKPRFIKSLVNIYKKDVPIFKVSKDQVFKYLQEHTNLGRWDSLKRAYNREKQKQKSRDIKFP